MIVGNTVVGWAGRAVSLATSLVSVPILVHYLGKDGFGVWLLLMNVWIMAGLFDLGIYQAYVRYVADDFASGDPQDLAATNASCLSLYLIISALVLAVYAVVAYYADAMFSIPPESTSLVRWALLPLAISSAASFPARIFEGLLFAQEKIYVYTAVGIPLNLGRLGLIIAALELGWGLIGVSLTFLVGSLAEYIIVAWLSLRRLPARGWLRPGWRGERIKQIVRYAADTMLLIVGNRVRARTPTLLMGILSNPVAVAKFGVGNRLMSQSVEQVTASVVAAQPRFSLLESAEEMDKLRELFLRTCFYTGLIAGFLAVGIVFLAKPFIYLWLGPEFDESVTVVHILVLPMTLFAALGPCEALLYSLKKQRITGLVSLAEVAVMVLVYYLILARMGASGAALGLGLALVCLRPWLLPTYICRRIGLPLWAFWLKGIGRAWLILGLAALALWPLFTYWHLGSWVALVAGGVVQCLVCVGFIAAGIGAEERSYWLGKLTTLRGRLAAARGKTAAG
ncbi:MAG: oligosaccharide flippase family protein [Thermodesulfobacteriota bacterium]